MDERLEKLHEFQHFWQGADDWLERTWERAPTQDIRNANNAARGIADRRDTHTSRKIVKVP
jgi:hypothetical protein